MSDSYHHFDRDLRPPIVAALVLDGDDPLPAPVVRINGDGTAVLLFQGELRHSEDINVAFYTVGHQASRREAHRRLLAMRDATEPVHVG